MYHSCNRWLIPSMASSTLRSPSATSRPCLTHLGSNPHSALHRCFSRGSCETSSKLRFSPSPWDCLHGSRPCCRGFCWNLCSTRTCFCFRSCTSSASMLSSSIIPGAGMLNPRTLSVPTISRSKSNRTRSTAASSTSVASSSKSKAKETPAKSPAIQEPSLTWGIVPHSSEGTLKVIEFLKKEGIDTSELHGVELPNTIEVMQERLDFLKKLGLSVEAINAYPLMVTCSIKKNLIPVLDYLERLGLRSQELPEFVEKYPIVLHSSVIVDLMPVVDYLLGLDIRRKDIIKVLCRYPDVLGFRLEGTMSTSVAYLVGLGVRTRCIGRMLTEYPEILGMRVARSIKPKVDFLTSYGVPKAVIAKLLEARPYILGFDLIETMEPVVNDLLEAGVKREGIAAIISQYPDILGKGIKEQVTRKTKWLVQQLEVSPHDVPVIIEKLPQILFIKEALALERVKFFKNYGCSTEDVAKMVTGCPQILALSIAQVIEPSMNFLLHDMRRSVKEVVEFPAYFTYDLKSRIIPRFNMIAVKDVDCSLEWFLNCTDQRFKLRLSDEYMDDDSPGPVFQMGGIVHTELRSVAEDSSYEETFSSESAQQRGKKAAPRSPRSSLPHTRDASLLHQKHRGGKMAEMNLDFNTHDENNIDREETRGVVHAGVRDIYDTDDDTDDAADILHARLQADDDLEELDSASDYDFSEEEFETDEDLEELRSSSEFDVSLEEEEEETDDDADEVYMSGTVSEFDESGEDLDEVDRGDVSLMEEEKVQHQFARKRF